MNCKNCQEDILDSLAAGENALSADNTRHLVSCTTCAVFHRQQRELFHSMQSALAASVNQPVPPSLVPGLRVRLDENPASPRFLLTGWKRLALPVVLVLVVGLGLLSRGSLRHNPVAIPAPLAAIPAAPVAAQAALDVVPSTPAVPGRSARRAARPHEDSKQPVEPEVIVLPEEREAFDRFIAQAPDNPEAILALTRPLPDGNDSAVQIALLAIKPLQVRPLESSEE